MTARAGPRSRPGGRGRGGPGLGETVGSVRTLRTLACVALLVVLAACGSGSDDSARPDRAARPTTTTTAPPPTTTTTAPRRFTVTGSRAGFAHGYELVRRESPADVEADLDLMASTGAKWLRASLTWGSIELQPGVYDWTGTDRVVQGALAARHVGRRRHQLRARLGLQARVPHRRVRAERPRAVRRVRRASPPSATRRSACTRGRSGTSPTTSRSGARSPTPSCTRTCSARRRPRSTPWTRARPS